MRPCGDSRFYVLHRQKLVAPSQDFDPERMLALPLRLPVRLNAALTISIERNHERL